MIMLAIEEKIKAALNLADPLDVPLPCYYMGSKKYLLFWDKPVSLDNMGEIPDWLDGQGLTTAPHEWKTFIVLGKTYEKFNPKKDLLFFNNVNTIVVFYLLNEVDNTVYKNTSIIPFIGMSPKKQLRAIDDALAQE